MKKVHLRRFGFGLVLAGGVSYGGFRYLDAQPKISFLGPNVTVEIVEEIDGIGQAISADGTIFATTSKGLEPFLSIRGGPWKPIRSLGATDRAWVTFIGNDGTVYGSTLVGTRVTGFSYSERNGVQFDRARTVNDGSPDGKILLYRTTGKNVEYQIVRPNGTVTILPPPGAKNGFYAMGMNDLGTRVYGQFGNGKRFEAFDWHDGKFTFHKGSTDIFHQTSSEDGSKGMLLVGRQIVRFTPSGRETVWSSNLGKPSTWDRFKTWVNKTTGTSLFSFARDPVNETLFAPFSAKDANWSLGTRLRWSRGMEMGTPVAWEGGSGWILLEDEIRKRGGKIPAGWSLDGITDVSADGQTIIGGARKGNRNAPYIVRFR